MSKCLYKFLINCQNEWFKILTLNWNVKGYNKIKKTSIKINYATKFPIERENSLGIDSLRYLIKLIGIDFIKITKNKDQMLDRKQGENAS